MPLTRRALLSRVAAAMALASAAGCRPRHGRAGPRTASDAAGLRAARETEAGLVAGYAAAAAATDAVTATALTALRDLHAQHLSALDRVLGAPASGSATPAPPVGTDGAALATATATSVPPLQAAATNAIDGDAAALLAGIAAAHAALGVEPGRRSG